MDRVRALVGDEAILDLTRLWLEGDVIDGKRRFRLTKGIVPQGSPISPLLSNLYLGHLDEALLEREMRLVRFSDDFLILCKSQERAEAALELTETVLQQLKLKINRDKTSVLNFNRGFRFLGVEFIRSLESKLNSPVRHPVSHFKLDYRRCVEHQINHLAAVVRGWEPRYRPALFR